MLGLNVNVTSVLETELESVIDESASVLSTDSTVNVMSKVSSESASVSSESSPVIPTVTIKLVLAPPNNSKAPDMVASSVNNVLTSEQTQTTDLMTPANHPTSSHDYKLASGSSVPDPTSIPSKSAPSKTSTTRRCSVSLSGPKSQIPNAKSSSAKLQRLQQLQFVNFSHHPSQMSP